MDPRGDRAFLPCSGIRPVPFVIERSSVQSRPVALGNLPSLFHIAALVRGGVGISGHFPDTFEFVRRCVHPPLALAVVRGQHLRVTVTHVFQAEHQCRELYDIGRLLSRSANSTKSEVSKCLAPTLGGDSTRSSQVALPLRFDTRCVSYRVEETGETMTDTRLDLPQGTLDLLILKALSLEPQHGWAISERIHQISREALDVQQGSLYPSLHRLERRGWIKARWGTSENNRRAKFYELTRRGRDQLATEAVAWQRLTAAIALVLKTT